jgi:purine-cytosine permease-like protein
VGAIWPAVMGALVAAAHPDLLTIAAVKTVADELFSGWGFWTLLLLAPTLIGATVLGIYTAGLSSLAAIDVVRPIKPGARARIIAVVAVSLVIFVATLLIPEDFLGTYYNFLLIVLYFLIPWTAVNLVDFFFVRKGHYAIRDIFRPDGIYGRVGRRGMIAYWTGFIVMIPFFSSTIFTGFIAKKLDGADLSPFIGFPVAAIVYYLLSRDIDVAAEARLADQQLEELEREAAAKQGS